MFAVVILRKEIAKEKSHLSSAKVGFLKFKLIKTD